jgi:hypothetical protein
MHDDADRRRKISGQSSDEFAQGFKPAGRSANYKKLDFTHYRDGPILLGNVLVGAYVPWASVRLGTG